MTSPSRRKRQITPAPTPPARTPVERAAPWLAVLAVLACAGLAPAQSPQDAEVIASHEPIPVPRVPTMQVPSPVRLARYQQPPRRPGTVSSSDDDSLDYQIQLEPPGLERLTLSLTSDGDLQERIRQETLKRTNGRERVVFPEEPILSRSRYYGRGGIWPQRSLVAEPNYVCYGKLYFEDRNSERYGWEIGMMQTFLSPAIFFADFAVWPCRIAKHPCDKNDCSAGHCLPGDPVPYRLFPPEITATGTLAEVATILALVAIFP